MPENILIVEYEPRYTDRVRNALAGQPFNPSFAKDGEEALRALDGPSPQLIVLSSVVPKVSTSELIRAIRGRDALQATPILLTISGYNGKSPKQDAVRTPSRSSWGRCSRCSACARPRRPGTRRSLRTKSSAICSMTDRRSHPERGDR